MNITTSSSSNSTGSNGGGGSESSVYRGVRKRKWGKWVSEIRLPNSRERIWLGSYDTPEKAARAFDAALFCLRGRTAQFNFPNDPPDIPNAESLSRSEIQAAAARYANEEQHRSVRNDSNNSNNHLSSVSDGVDYNSSTMDWEFLDLMGKADQNLNINNGNDFMLDYGIYPGVNEFPGDFITTSSSPSEFDYGDGEFSNQQSFLWNF